MTDRIDSLTVALEPPTNFSAETIVRLIWSHMNYRFADDQACARNWEALRKVVAAYIEDQQGIGYTLHEIPQDWYCSACGMLKSRCECRETNRRAK